MAKIKLTETSPHVNGHRHGLVYFYGFYSQVVRNRSGSRKQQNVLRGPNRSYFATLSKWWRDSTKCNQASYNAFRVSRSSGFAYWIGVASKLKLLNTTPPVIASSVTPVNFIAFNFISYNFATSQALFSLTYTGSPSGHVLVYSTPPNNSPVQGNKNRFQFVGFLTPPASGTINLFSVLNTRYPGIMNSGLYLNIRVQFCSISSGRTNTPKFASFRAGTGS